MMLPCILRQGGVLPVLAVALYFQSEAYAAIPGNEQFLHQQSQQKALEQQLNPPAPDVRLSEPAKWGARVNFPLETPCFDIQRVTLDGLDNLPYWLPLRRIASQANGHCLGGQGINMLMGALQNRLIDSGYITTRVLAPAQNLSSGELKLMMVPGKVHEVKLTPQSDRYVTLYSAFPPHAGNLLDLRGIEQGLENLQRLPTVQASMEIVPGEKPGESDILLDWKQSKMWRLGASLDDSGTTGTGRYQGGLTFTLDNPLSLSDLFYVSGSHDLESGGGKGTKNFTAHYSVPFGYWLVGVTGNEYHYHQTVAGANQDYSYSGKSKSLDAQLSRVLHRNATQKTTLTGYVIVREQRSYFEDTEIEVQRRRTSAWRLGLQHRHYLNWATLDAGVSYQRGTRWFGAMPAPEEYRDAGTALSKILQYNAQADVPFSLLGQRFHYNVQYLRQSTNTPLTPQDSFSIGNRWTVRGFDGERTLTADEGWYVRNDIGWYLPLQGHEFYLGADYGEISGRGSQGDESIGKHLAGGVTGLRGYVWNTGYDLFAGIPLSKPAGYHTSGVTFGFNLNWNY